MSGNRTGGGGVGDGPRRELLALCDRHGVRPIEVFGPANLEPALAALPG
jgi:hypothetical protein